VTTGLPAVGSIKPGSLFLTLPTRELTVQHVISSAGYGALHNRMPVVLKPEVWPEWLAEEPADAPQLQALLARHTARSASSS
jgi:putative SOS response-associated peptidase YedK